MKPSRLCDLEADVARDLRLIDYPNAPWTRTVDGVLDVLIVGGGQGGLAIAAKLKREQVRNIVVVDESVPGEEGIWMRYARMQTLRTPKHIGGPDLGVPSLTFQAWYEAQHGAAAFAAIKYIPKADWQAYLGWYRRVLNLPVRNGVRFVGVSPRGALLCVRLQEGDATRELLTRKLVLAGGIETSGRWWTPPAIKDLPPRFRAHTSEPIDFARLRGKRVVVVGAAASAFDNAATALEHGAEVRMLCRRRELQRVQPYKVLAFPGFLEHFGSLPDADRWRMMTHLLTVREALTAETWARVTRHSAFHLITGAPVSAAHVQDEAIVIDTPREKMTADFVIAGTGFDVDMALRPELADLAREAATWADRYSPPPGQVDTRLARYPYLDAGMAFTEKTPGQAPWISNIYCFNFGATVSFGPSGSSISAMKYAVPRIVSAITRSLFLEDFASHEQMIRAYETPEFELRYARDLQPALG